MAQNQIRDYESFSSLVFEVAESAGLKLNSKQVQRLFELQTSDGKRLLDNDTTLLEALELLIREGFGSAITKLEKIEERKALLWELPWTEEYQRVIRKEILSLRSEEIGIKGVGKCPKCGSQEITMAHRMVTSGDEPMRVFNSCVLCGYRWRS